MEQKPTLFVYPTRQRLDDAIEKLVAGDNDTALFTSDMMTFARFEEFLTRQLLPPQPAISELNRSWIMINIVQRHFVGKKGSLADIVKYSGFVPALLFFFDELGAGLVGPDKIKKIIGYAHKKESDISALYSAYRAELARAGLTDAGIIRERIIAALHKDEAKSAPILAGCGKIVLIDIYQYTPYRFEMFRAIAQYKPVEIIAPVPDDRYKAFGFIVHNLSKFEALGDQEGLLNIHWREPSVAPLNKLSSEIFSLTGSKAKSEDINERVKILECASRYREMEEVGLAIHELKEKEGLNWSDFAIVFRSPTIYSAIAIDVFKRYKIPFFMKRGMTLAQNPLARSIFALFEAIDSGFTRDSVVRIIGSPYFERFSKIDIDEAQSCFIGAKIIDGPSNKWKALLEKSIDKRRLKNRKAKAMVAETLWLIKELEKFSTASSPEQFFRKISQLLNRLGFSPAPSARSESSDTFRDNAAYGQIIAFIDEANRTSAKVAPHGLPISYTKLRDTFLGHIENMALPEEGSADRNRVVALSAHDAIGVNFKVVFVSGLHEREFPLQADLRSILSESERDAFNEKLRKTFFEFLPHLAKGHKTFDRAITKWQEESLLFYQGVAAAKERIWFTYSTADLSGSPLMRSQFIDDVLDVLEPDTSVTEREKIIQKTETLAIMKESQKLLDPAEEQAKLLYDIFSTKNNEIPAQRKIEQRIGNISGRWDRFTRLLDLADMERGRDLFFYEPEIATKLESATEFDGVIPKSAPLLNQFLAVHRKGRYAPTDLEKYGQCPFRYFASKPLKLGPVDEPVMEIDAMNKGSMAHDILESFYAKLIEENRFPLNGNDIPVLNILDETMVEVFASYEKEGKTGDPSIFKVEKERMGHMLLRWLDFDLKDQQNSGYYPVAVEATFDLPPDKKSKHKEIPDGTPLLIPVSCGGDRYLIGKADRIDVNHEKEAIRVIDYKTSASRSKYMKMTKRPAMGQTSFQLPLYMILARNYVIDKKILEKVSTSIGGYGLLNTKADGKPFALTDDKRVKAEEKVDDGEFLAYKKNQPLPENSFLSHVARVIESIEGGMFPVTPESCEYCDYAGLCRYVATPYADEGNGDE